MDEQEFGKPHGVSDEQQSLGSVKHTMSRGDFLRRVGLGALASSLGLASGANCATDKPKPGEGTLPESRKPEAFIPKLGKEVLYTSLKKYGIEYAPDANTAQVVTTDGPVETNPAQTELYITGIDRTYKVKYDPNLKELKPVDTQATRLSVFGPENVPGYNYASIAAVVQPDRHNKNHLTGFAHGEQWRAPGDGKNFKASIVPAYSKDGGTTWRADTSKIYSGLDPARPGERVSGAGQPAAVLKQEGNDVYAYVYHTDWPSEERVRHGAQIYVIRNKINADGTLSDYEQLTDHGFTKATQGTEARAVITIPDHLENPKYVALPSVVFDKDKNKFIMSFETDIGFCYTESTTGLQWDKPEVFFPFASSLQERKPGERWNSYPSIIKIGNQWHFMYSEGIHGGPGHQPVMRTIELPK